MAQRVEAIDAAGEERDGRAVAGEGGPMRHAVDAVGAARDDGEPTVDEARRGFHRDVLAVAGRRASADEGDRRHAPGERVGAAANPQADRRVHAEFVDAARPRGIAGHDVPRADARRLRQGAGERAVIEPREPAPEARLGLVLVELTARLGHLVGEPIRASRPARSASAAAAAPIAAISRPRTPSPGSATMPSTARPKASSEPLGVAPNGGELAGPLRRRSFDELHIVIPFLR